MICFFSDLRSFRNNLMSSSDAQHHEGHAHGADKEISLVHLFSPGRQCATSPDTIAGIGVLLESQSSMGGNATSYAVCREWTCDFVRFVVVDCNGCHVLDGVSPDIARWERWCSWAPAVRERAPSCTRLSRQSDRAGPQHTQRDGEGRKLRRSIGVAFQNAALFNFMSVKDNKVDETPSGDAKRGQLQRRLIESRAVNSRDCRRKAHPKSRRVLSSAPSLSQATDVVAVLRIVSELGLHVFPLTLE